MGCRHIYWALVLLSAALTIELGSCDGADTNNVVDAILLRTHMVDNMVLQRLSELVISVGSKSKGENR